ncbi:unnamed protein product [Alopecurus aequalis]
MSGLMTPSFGSVCAIRAPSRDTSLFYACTVVSIVNGLKAPFWDSPWLQWQRPRDIAPLIFSISNVADDIILPHIQQFVALWTDDSGGAALVRRTDTITWTLSSSGVYSASSAYHAQFLGSISSGMKSTVWKVWAPPKCKFFAWLIIQNRIWTADRLQRCGWPNCDLCPLCKQTQESAAHLMFQCPFSIRILNMVKTWLGLPWLDVTVWTNFGNVRDWWTHMNMNDASRRKAAASLTMLVSWELWSERNARVFRGKSTLPSIVLDRIKDETRTWAKAGAKHLEFLLPGD